MKNLNAVAFVLIWGIILIFSLGILLQTHKIESDYYIIDGVLIILAAIATFGSVRTKNKSSADASNPRFELIFKIIRVTFWVVISIVVIWALLFLYTFQHQVV